MASLIDIACPFPGDVSGRNVRKPSVRQENEVDRIGGSRPIPIDLRVIATTNRDLEAWVKKENCERTYIIDSR
jgi:hypothetical protein